MIPAKPTLTVREWIVSPAFHQALSTLLPGAMRPERFVRIALQALTRTPLLMEADRPSLFNALLTLSALGLEPDGRNAHVVPFRNAKRGVVEVTLIIDYKGYVHLILGSGRVSYLHADVVCDKDKFEYDRGQVRKHVINFREPRGEIYAAYALARMKDGAEVAVAMSREEIESARARSPAAKSGPWVTDYAAMCRKTPLRRLQKLLRLTPVVSDAERAEDDSERGDLPLLPETGQFLDILGEKTVQPPSAPPQPGATQQHQTAVKLQEAGVPFDDFRDFASIELGAKSADSWADWSEVPVDIWAKVTEQAAEKCIRLFGKSALEK